MLSCTGVHAKGGGHGCSRAQCQRTKGLPELDGRGVSLDQGARADFRADEVQGAGTQRARLLEAPTTGQPGWRTQASRRAPQ